MELEGLKERLSREAIDARENSVTKDDDMELRITCLNLRVVIGTLVAKEYALCPPFKENQGVVCQNPADTRICRSHPRSLCPGTTHVVSDCTYDNEFGWLVSFHGSSWFERYDADDFAQLQM